MYQPNLCSGLAVPNIQCYYRAPINQTHCSFVDPIPLWVSLDMLNYHHTSFWIYPGLHATCDQYQQAWLFPILLLGEEVEVGLVCLRISLIVMLSTLFLELGKYPSVSLVTSQWPSRSTRTTNSPPMTPDFLPTPRNPQNSKQLKIRFPFTGHNIQSFLRAWQ